MHYRVDEERCTGCGGCAALCPVDAIEVTARAATITADCIGCGNCAGFCPVRVIAKVSQ